MKSTVEKYLSNVLVHKNAMKDILVTYFECVTELRSWISSDLHCVKSSVQHGLLRHKRSNISSTERGGEESGERRALPAISCAIPVKKRLSSVDASSTLLWVGP